MAKLLEDIQVRYDGTVSGQNNNIIQFSYGGDSFDRNELSFNKDGKVFFIDPVRLAEKLNNEFELSSR